MTAIGARVWAFKNATDDTVYAYGFGTYAGDHLMPGWDHPAQLARCEQTLRNHDAKPPWSPRSYYHQLVTDGVMTRAEADTAIADGEAFDLAQRARPLPDRVLDLAQQLGMNPQIKLNAGGWVWGAECWWGEADDDTPALWAKGRRIVAVAAARPAAIR